MAEKQLVLSFFADEPAADAAALALKDSGIAAGDAIGLLVLDATGNLKVDKVGARSWAAGAGIGACLVVLGPALLGVGLVGGTLGGGLHHKGLKLDDADRARIAADLKAGKAAVGVLARITDGPRGPGEADGTRWRDLRPRCGRRGGPPGGSGGVTRPTSSATPVTGAQGARHRRFLHPVAGAGSWPHVQAFTVKGLTPHAK